MCYILMHEGKKYKSYGVPQGDIASPTLFNIYIHELDKFIKTNITQHIDEINEIQIDG